MLLIVRVHDKVHPDPVVDASFTKRGDVIDCLPDNEPLGGRVLDHPDWRVLQVADWTADDTRLMTAPGVVEAGGLGEAAPTLVPARFWRLDLDALAAVSPALRAFLDDDTRARLLVVVAREAVLASKRRPAPCYDPRVLG